MSVGAKLIKIPIVVAAIASLAATLPAYSQGMGKKGGSHASAAQARPMVDEKAYKAALDRIPAPKQGYDPWGQARQSDPAKTPTKPNQ